MTRPTSGESSRRKTLWFIALYIAGVVVTAGASYALRLLVI